MKCNRYLTRILKVASVAGLVVIPKDTPSSFLKEVRMVCAIVATCITYAEGGFDGVELDGGSAGGGRIDVRDATLSEASLYPWVGGNKRGEN